MRRVVKRPPLFITGTGTGVGKTTLTALLTLHLRRRGIRALAIKPYCSGTWEDAALLAAVNDHELTERQITPVFCRAPLAPMAGLEPGAAQAGFRAAVKAVEETSQNTECLLIEGIGGLEVPLAPGVAVSDLIARTQSDTVIVARNRLGVLNEAALTQHRLREKTGKTAPIILTEERKLDESASSNARILANLFEKSPVIALPYLGGGMNQTGRLQQAEKKIIKILAQILESVNVFPAARRREKNFREKH